MPIYNFGKVVGVKNKKIFEETINWIIWDLGINKLEKQKSM